MNLATCQHTWSLTTTQISQTLSIFTDNDFAFVICIVVLSIIQVNTFLLQFCFLFAYFKVSITLWKGPESLKARIFSTNDLLINEHSSFAVKMHTKLSFYWDFYFILPPFRKKVGSYYLRLKMIYFYGVSFSGKWQDRFQHQFFTFLKP